MKTIEIVASYSGKIGEIPGDKYGSESPFFSRKLVIEDCVLSEEDVLTLQLDLALECYDLFQAFKEEAIRRKSSFEPVCSEPKLEEIRQKAIVLIREQGKWFKDKKEAGAFKVLFEMVTGDKLETEHQIEMLTFGNSRQLNRILGAWQSRLNGVKKTEEKTNAKKEITETSEAS